MTLKLRWGARAWTLTAATATTTTTAGDTHTPASGGHSAEEHLTQGPERKLDRLELALLQQDTDTRSMVQTVQQRQQQRPRRPP